MSNPSLTGTQNPGSSSGGSSTPADNSVTSAKIVDGAIVNADINAAAAIAATKISGTAITAADTGTVTSTMILDGTILNADINASAAIAATKISGTAITAADTGTVTSAMITDATIATGDIANLAVTTGLLAANAVTTAKLATGIPQSLTASGSSTAAIADTSAHIVASPPYWNGTGWIGLGTPNYYLNGSNANVAEVYPRGDMPGVANATTALPAAGVMLSGAVVLYAGMTITNIVFRTGTTAATWGSSNDGNWWVALYDTQATPALIAQSTTGGHTGLAASTVQTVALGSPAPYLVATTGVYYISLMVNTGTTGPVQPTVIGSTGPSGVTNGVIVTGQKSILVSSGTSLSTTAPGTIASASSFGAGIYLATS